MTATPLEPNLPAARRDNNPEPPSDDCPAIVEQLAEFADDLDMLGTCAVHLLEQVPRTENAASERALRRVGRIVERIAQAAQGAAQYAQAAVAVVHRPRATEREGGGGEPRP